jgi:hypothetical protein
MKSVSRTAALLAIGCGFAPAQDVRQLVERLGAATTTDPVRLLNELWSIRPSPAPKLVAIATDASVPEHARCSALMALYFGTFGGAAAADVRELSRVAARFRDNETGSERMRLVGLQVLAELGVAVDRVDAEVLTTSNRFGVLGEIAAPEAEFGLYTHWFDLTEPALQEDLGWLDPTCVGLVVDGNLATDLEWLTEEWYGFWFKATWSNASAQIEAVAMMKTIAQQCGFRMEFHFDDLFTFAEIATEWRRLEQVMVRTLASLDRAEWNRQTRDRTLAVLGVVHHAVQDFYCHSNWCHVFWQRVGSATRGVPTWEEYVADPLAFGFASQILESSTPTMISPDRRCGGLQTGRWAREGAGGSQPWTHVHVDDEEAIAIQVARRASVHWTRQFEQHMSPKRREAFEALARRR